MAPTSSTSEAEQPCQCGGPGFCPRYQHAIGPVDWERCAGRCPPERSCTPEDTLATRRYLYHRYRGGPLPEPSLAERFKAFLQAIKLELAWRTAGGRAPTPEEKAERGRICRSNACRRYDAEKDVCLACGCYLEAGLLPPRPLGKLDCASQACPLGYWGTLGGYQPSSRCCGG